MRDEAQKRIGHLYPPVEVTAAMADDRPDLKQYVGQKLTVIAWIWARTVKSPNPAFRYVDMPLASTFVLSSKAGKEAYVGPLIEGDSYKFTVNVGRLSPGAKPGTKLGRGNFQCLLSGAPISGEYIRGEARARRRNSRLMAIVTEGRRGRVYFSPISDHEAAADKAAPDWKPDVEFFQQALGFRVGNYGMSKWSDLFTDRQLVALTTFTDLVDEARQLIYKDALASSLVS
jgi:putative DNA methylase